MYFFKHMPLTFFLLQERLSAIYDSQDDFDYSDLSSPYRDEDEIAGTDLTREELMKIESATYLPELS